MKRVLFGIMGLSIAAFAANPGELTGGAGTASVPVKVLAEVIAPVDALVITDEAGNILADGIVLDHGLRTQTDEIHTTAPFRFKVKRMSEGDDSTTAYAPIKGTLKVTVADVDNDSTQEVNLGRVGGNPGDNLISKLTLANGNNLSDTEYGYVVNMGTTAKEHTGEITSTVDFTNAKPGKYDSTADPSGNGTATLKVVLAVN
ncbi:MAG: hypothetical protein ACRC92_23065 [Peptostreptococcaceae bacterium]